jgi:P4 family phage/plasmid primase-like protien
MGVQENFRTFINKYKVEKGKPFTNTSIGNPKVSLFIPDDKYDDFIEIYSLALTNDISLHFTEKPIDPSPLRIDIDFRFAIQENLTDRNPANNKRIYTNEHIFNIVNNYFIVINKFINVGDEDNIAYVMEKPNPTDFRNKIKDGLHIIFPKIIVSNNVQHYIRKKILDIAADLFKGLPVCNEFESIIDKAIIDVNCWQMYGSRKPDCEAYRVSKVYNYINKTTVKKDSNISAADELNFIKLFSMRKNTLSTTPVFDNYVNEIDEYIKHVLPSFDQKQKTKLHNNIFSKSLNINKNYTTDDELILSRQLVSECLSYTRAEKYDDWINLGWVLRNIDYRLLDTWVEFSKIGSAFIEGECQTLWNKMRKDHMGIGTLRWWAKQDNIRKYNEIIDESIIPLIDQCIRSDGSHYDVAKVVQAQYKDDFKSISKDLWYKYDKNKHRWVKSREGLNLRLILSTEICKKFVERSQQWNTQLYNDDGNNDEQKSLNEEKCKKCMAIALKLKNAGFKDSIMKECKCLFIEDKFEELLDSRSHLIGFDNGVYDLKMHIFRDGMPDDYICHSTNINYIPYCPESIEVREINEFLSKIFTNENVKNYMLDIITCIIDGSIAQERFYIFTGQGSNGKSRLLELIQKAIGDYYCILPIALLTQKRAASNSASGELERTKGRRFAVMQEPSENDKINIGFMKELSGNDRILTRGLYKDPYEFKPQFKMILTCNELPEVPSDDGGTWRRIRVIEFLSRFCEKPTKPNEFAMDLELSDNFDRWAEPFMSMLINRHKSINPNALHEPMEVRISTESYKNNNDIIGQYMNEKITRDDTCNDRMGIAKIYNDFRVWCIQNIPKGKKYPDRNQLKAYLEKLLGAYPIDNKGWKGLKYNTVVGNDEDD